MACTVIPTKIPTIDKTAIPTNKYQRYQPRGGGMIPIPEKWLVYDWYATLLPMFFLRERDFSRDCKTRLLARLCRVLHGLVGKVCGGRLNVESFGREARSVPYILCTYQASLVSNVLQDRACETRPRFNRPSSP